MRHIDANALLREIDQCIEMAETLEAKAMAHIIRGAVLTAPTVGGVCKLHYSRQIGAYRCDNCGAVNSTLHRHCSGCGAKVEGRICD